MSSDSDVLQDALQSDGNAVTVRGWSSPVWLASLFVFALGVGLTLWLGFNHRDAAMKERDATLRQAAVEASRTLSNQLMFAGMVLRSAQAILESRPEVTEDAFRMAYERLRPEHVFPSVQSLSYSVRTTGVDGDVYVTRMVQPVKDNSVLIGLDLRRQPQNLRATQSAAASNKVVMSAPFRLLQNAEPASAVDGISIRLPVHANGDAMQVGSPARGQVAGAIGLAFHARKLICNSVPESSKRKFRMRVVDTTDAQPFVLFDSHANEPRHVLGPFSVQRHIDFGGRKWTLSFASDTQAGPPLPGLFSSTWPGLLASTLLALLIWSWGTTRQRAIQLGHRMGEQYRESEARLRILHELLPAQVLLVRVEDGAITYANRTARERFGEDVAESGALVRLLLDPESASTLQQQATQELHAPMEMEFVDGEGVPFWASVSVSELSLGGKDKWLLVISDVGEQHALRKQLEYQATHDDLTGLYNRREFERRLDEMLDAVKPEHPQGAVLYIDLDQFKLVNDTSGHAAGDQLLAHLAVGMVRQLRGSDVLARLGGDEFGVLTPHAEREGADVLARRLREYVESYHFIWEQRSYKLSTSIGVVLIEAAGLSSRDVMAQADSACYIAKEHGRNRIHFHAMHDDETVRHHSEMEWANRLRWVIEEQRLLLDYQEVRSLRHEDGDAPHVELLLRLRDEQDRIVLPGAFLPAAERYGLMPMLDRWVVEQAISNFPRLHPSGPLLGRCSVNLSAVSLDDEALVDNILRLLALHHVPPSRMCFEITETAAVRNVARMVRFVDRLRSVGCLVALDDFGSGMSSFGYLRDLPLDVIKIDGSFIQDLEDDAMGCSIVKAVTEIAHQQQLEVVAEWVDSTRTVELLRSIGVDYGQGNFLHAPERVLFQRDGVDDAG